MLLKWSYIALTNNSETIPFGSRMNNKKQTKHSFREWENVSNYMYQDINGC